MDITIDIETVANPILMDLSKIDAPSNYKDVEKIQAYKLEKQQEERLKTPLKSLKGFIFCVGLLIDGKEYCFSMDNDTLHKYQMWVETPMFYNDNEPLLILQEGEKKMLTELDKFIESLELYLHNPSIIGHYIKSFDLPFLFHRAIKYNLKNLYNFCNVNRFSKHVFDTHEMFALTDYRNHYSLSDILEFLGLDNHKKETNGGMVQELFDTMQYDRITEYCIKDVIAEYNVFNELNKFNYTFKNENLNF